jgi:hypothetical protein
VVDPLRGMACRVTGSEYMIGYLSLKFEALSWRPTNCKYRSHRYHIIQWVNTYHVGQQEFREISLASVSNPFTRLSMIQATSYMYTYHGIT